MEKKIEDFGGSPNAHYKNRNYYLRSHGYLDKVEYRPLDDVLKDLEG
jgi:hypothetical protein